MTIAPEPFDLQDPALYLNRELSILDFNLRVLEQATDRRHPLTKGVVKVHASTR